MRILTTTSIDEPDAVTISGVYSLDNPGLTLTLHRDGSGAFELLYVADDGSRLMVGANRGGGFMVRQLDPEDDAAGGVGLIPPEG